MNKTKYEEALDTIELAIRHPYSLAPYEVRGSFYKLKELVEIDKLKKTVKGSAKIPIELLNIREDEREELIKRAIKSALYNGIDNIPVEFIPRIEVDGDETGYYQGVLSVEFKFDIYPVSTEG